MNRLFLRAALTLFNILFVFALCLAQDYSNLNFEVFNAKNGLPSEECNFVFQDSDNFLWIGSQEGLMRFDGYELINFKDLTKSDLSNINFTDAAEDQNKNLWFTTSNGFLFYNKKNDSVNLFTSADFPDLYLNGPFNSILCDNENSVWIGTDNGLYRYSQISGILKHYPGPNNTRCNCKELVKTESGDIWMSSWNQGIARYNKSKDNFEFHDIFESRKADFAKAINSLYAYKKNYLLAGQWETGLHILDISNPETPEIIKTFRHTTTQKTKNLIPGNIILSIRSDIYDNLWVGTPYGLGIIKDPLSESPQSSHIEASSHKNNLSNNVIRHIFKDKTDIMWLSTTGGGVNKTELINQKFETKKIPVIDPQKKSQSIHAFSIDNKERLLVGVKSLGFVVADKKQKKTKHFSKIDNYKSLQKFDINTVNCFAWDNDSNLWIGTRYRGLIKLNPESGETYVMNPRNKNKLFFSREVRSILHCKNNQLWVATENGVYHIKPAKDKSFFNFKVQSFRHIQGDSTTIPSNNISDLVMDNDGNIWVSTFQNGLARSTSPIAENNQKTAFKRYSWNDGSGLTTNHIISLFSDSKENIWIGSGDGLKKWDPVAHKFVSPIPENPMNGTIIYGIEEDANGSIWATSNTGVICLKKKGEEDYVLENYTSRDGLQGEVFIKGAIKKDKKGLFYIGGHNGYNIFNPLSIKTDNYIPSLHITSLNLSGKEINGSKITEDSTIIIKHNEKYISISFAALDFRNPQNIKYRYKLEGFDEHWQNAGANARNATYANLGPGKYTFIVKGSNSFGVWNPKPTKFHLEVLQAPYKTWWAFTFYILFLLGLVFAFTYLYFSGIKTKQALKIEHLEREKSEQINQFKLQFFTNLSHELLTPLSILKILSEKWEDLVVNKKDEVRNILGRNVSRLSQLIYQVLQFRKVETGNIKLNLHEVNLSSFTKEILDNYNLLAEEKNISLKTDLPHELWGWIDTEKLDISLNNILSNAFKYTSPGGEVSLNLEAFQREKHHWVSFQISDNGRGIPPEKIDTIFDRFYRIGNGGKEQEGAGIGLALTKNLIELHGGSIEVTSLPGSGTTFTIQLPFSKDFYEEIDIKKQQPIIDPQKIRVQSPKEDENLPKIQSQKDKKILLIEDDQDFLELITFELEKYFTVHTAPNGKEGIKAAKEKAVDLIVSDVMMPEMSGKEVCKLIKNDINTSHIPFILITAFQQDEERLEGYESGADSFLTKPITPILLLTRIESLLKKRNELKANFDSDEFLEPEKITIPSIDKKILEQAKEIVEQEMSNPDLSVKMMCEQLGLSNSMFYRKMKALLDMTPNEFIRSIRLRRAAQLLKDNSINVSEAAYSTGFNDLSYFGVCFKKEYGVTPTAYQKRTKREL
ncbi:hybrid sensor histidine kinase/response regulator transcription factor [Marinilabilia rubra]|nr:two-component regulator propeller domain-containing protein [Marinilabilia rubra]